MFGYKPATKLAFVGILAVVLPALPCFADSQARIVRLSDVQGSVQIDRAVGQGYEKAFLNLPITQGAKVQTKDGRAQIEFEDGSTLRITPDTVLQFSDLLLRDSGARVSTVHVQEGKAYVNFHGTKDDELTLTFGREKAVITQAAHVRLEMGDAQASLAVFNGVVEIEGPFGKMEVAKNHTLTLDLADPKRYTTAKWVDDDPYDAWDKQQDQYQQRYASTQHGLSSGYGNSDLNYYGSFTDVPGYGTLWQPYLAGAGWDPFMDGAWAFNPGFGYGWVSAYPWGWTPYYSGEWMFVPGYGWMWEPGAWGGLGFFPTIVNPPLGYGTPRPPNIPGQRIIPVNHTTTPVPATDRGKMTLVNNSAGLGIPRGGIKNLPELSHTVQERGSAITKVGSIGPTTRATWWGGGFSNSGYSASAPHSMAGSGYHSSGMGGMHSSGGGGHAGGGHR